MSSLIQTVISRKSQVSPQAMLCALQGPNAGREYMLLGTEVQLGRGEECDIVLHDLNASRAHALIRNHGGTYTLLDLQSKNGTLVNESKVSEQTLRENDMVQIGESIFRFRTQASSTTAEPQSFHMTLNFSKKARIRLPVSRLWKLVVSKTGQLLKGKNKMSLGIWIVAILLTANLWRGSNKQAPPTPSATPVAETQIQTASHPAASAAAAIPASTASDRSLARERYSQAMQAMQAADYKRAITLFTQVRQLDPEHPAAASKLKLSEEQLHAAIEQYYNSGLREFAKMYYDRAMQEWEKAASLSADFDLTTYQKSMAKIQEAKNKMEQTR